ELRRRLDRSAETLADIAARIARRGDAIRDAPRDSNASRQLFDAISAALPADETGRMGVTVYDPAGSPLAWAGHVAELQKNQLTGPSALFVAPSALGPRLVLITPLIVPADRSTATRIGSVVVEQLLGPPRTPPSVGAPEAVIVPTSLAPVSPRVHADGLDASNPYAFPIPRPSGDGRLVEGETTAGELADARARWRSGTWAAVWSVLAITLLLGAGPLLEMRRTTRDMRGFSVLTGAIVFALVAARLLFWFGAAPILGTDTLTSPLDLLLDALLVAALTWLALDLVERRRVVPPRPGLLVPTTRSLVWLAAAYAAAAAIGAWLVFEYLEFLNQLVSNATLEVLHFSLHPISASRLAIGFGLVLLHASVIWAAVAVLRLPTILWRTPRRGDVHLVPVLGWLLGTAAAIFILTRRSSVVPIAPMIVAVAVAGGCAGAIASIRGRARR